MKRLWKRWAAVSFGFILGIMLPFTASATLIDYSSTVNDDGIEYVGSNSGTARDNFIGAVSGLTQIDFESALPGGFSTLSLDPNVSATLFNTDTTVGINEPGIAVAQQVSDKGFNTTGSSVSHPVPGQYVQVVPGEDPNVESGIQLDFAIPIEAFGVFLMGLEEDPLNPQKRDVVVDVYFVGSAIPDQTFPTLTGPISEGGIQFFGFESTDPVASVVFREVQSGYPEVGRDIFGIDDVLYKPVPEPATLALVTIGAGGLGFFRRRKRLNKPE